jgi:hypothetical protein
MADDFTFATHLDYVSRGGTLQSKRHRRADDYRK